MISIINDYTVGEFLDEYDINTQDGLRECCHYYVENGLIMLSRDFIPGYKVTSQNK